MNKVLLKKIADNADMIVNGYSFTRTELGISILNLNHPKSAMLISEDGVLLETNMDDIEQVLVLKMWKSDSKYMENLDA